MDSETFKGSLETTAEEVKKQFLNGASKVVLTRDGDAIFCEPEYKE